MDKDVTHSFKSKIDHANNCFVNIIQNNNPSDYSKLEKILVEILNNTKNHDVQREFISNIFPHFFEIMNIFMRSQTDIAISSRTLELVLKCAANCAISDNLNKNLIFKNVTIEHMIFLVNTNHQEFGDIFAMLLYNCIDIINPTYIISFLNCLEFYYKCEWVTVLLLELASKDIIETIFHQLIPDRQFQVVSALSEVIDYNEYFQFLSHNFLSIINTTFLALLDEKKTFDSKFDMNVTRDFCELLSIILHKRETVPLDMIECSTFDRILNEIELMSENIHIHSVSSTAYEYYLSLLNLFSNMCYRQTLNNNNIQISSRKKIVQRLNSLRQRIGLVPIARERLILSIKYLTEPVN